MGHSQHELSRQLLRPGWEGNAAMLRGIPLFFTLGFEPEAVSLSSGEQARLDCTRYPLVDLSGS